MKAYIYYLQCPKTKEIRYIGQTTATLKNRLKNHIYETKRNIRLGKFLTHKENWIKNLIQESIENKIEIILLEECEIEISNEREVFWISKFQNLTNIDIGGKRKFLTPETKRKISFANSGSKNGMFGKRYKRSEEHVEISRNAMIKSEKFQKSRKSEEYRKKISLIQKIDDWLLLNEKNEIVEVFNTSSEVANYLGCTKGNVKNARRDNRVLMKQYFVVYRKDYGKII
jgi:group I intron endonuclease